jgi:septin 3/9/12
VVVTIAGQTGLGKSTLINTLFASHLIDSQGRKEVDEPVPQTAAIKDNVHGEWGAAKRGRVDSNG